MIGSCARASVRGVRSGMADLAGYTAVEKLAEGEYRGFLSSDWAIWGPNGGFVAAVALRAAGAHTQFPRPASIAGHFLSVADFGPVDITVTTVRTTRRVESLRVMVSQNAKPVFTALVWALDTLSGIQHEATPMPDVPEPDGLATFRELWTMTGRDLNPFNDRFDRRPLNWTDPGSASPDQTPNIEWWRFLEAPSTADRWVDACRGVILSEAGTGPPSTRLVDGAPTIELSVQLHASRPECDWMLVSGEVTTASEGLLGARANVWAQGGTLVASSASLLLSPPQPN